MSAYSMGDPPQGKIRLPGQSDLICADIFDVRSSDNGASMYVATNRTAIINLYDGVRPTAENSMNSIGDLKECAVECYGNIDTILQGKQNCYNCYNTLIDGAFIPGLDFELFSLHAVQAQEIVLGGVSVHLVWTFPFVVRLGFIYMQRISKEPHSILLVAPVCPPTSRVAAAAISPGKCL